MKIITSSEFIGDQAKEVELYTLKNTNGLVCQLTNYGARIVSIYTPDRTGEFKDIAIGYATAEDYLNKEEIYFGTTVGRYGNRIANAAFSLDSVNYKLNKNNGPNSLHGGPNGFHSQIWTVLEQTTSSISFTYTSAAMEEGFPGTVEVHVKFKLNKANELKISYTATTNAKTILNLTNHTYFNLSGHGNNSIEQHQLQINADRYTPVNSNLIPLGSLDSVKNTPFDFRTLKPIGKDIELHTKQLEIALGYDHNYVLNPSANGFAAKVVDPSSGRTLEVFTNEPGLQFYSGNFLNKIQGKYGHVYSKRNAFCLETQHFPDSPNQPSFPSVVLEVGEEYSSYCTYKFGVE